MSSRKSTKLPVKKQPWWHTPTWVLGLGLFFCLWQLGWHFLSLKLPLYNEHHFRQSDTYAMAVLMHEGQANIFFPRFFHAMNPDNYQHFYLAELPLYQQLVAALFKIFGESVVVARLVNLFFSAVILTGVVGLARHFFSRYWAFGAGLLCSIFPLFYFWSQGVTPDIIGLAGYVVSTALLLSVRPSNLRLTYIASLCFAVAVATKPFYLAALIFHIVYFKQHSHSWKDFLKELGRFYLSPLSFFLVWRWWLLQFPPAALTDPDLQYLLHNRQGYWQFFVTSNWVGVFMQSYFFGRLLTPLGGLLAIVGLINFFRDTSNHKKNLIMSLLATSILIVLVVAEGSEEHSYYLLHWLPILTVLAIKGIETLSTGLYKYWLSQQNSLTVIWQSSIVSLVIVFLGLIPFMSHTEQLFGIQTTFYSETRQQDYRVLSASIPPDKMVTMILSEYSPWPLNMMRRFGYIVGYYDPSYCQNPDELQHILDEYSSRTEYLAISMSDSNTLDCYQKLKAGEYQGHTLVSVVIGQDFELFKFIKYNYQ